MRAPRRRLVILRLPLRLAAALLGGVHALGGGHLSLHAVQRAGVRALLLERPEPLLRLELKRAELLLLALSLHGLGVHLALLVNLLLELEQLRVPLGLLARQRAGVRGLDRLHLLEALEPLLLLPAPHLGFHAPLQALHLALARLLNLRHALRLRLPRHLHRLQLLRALLQGLDGLLARQQRVLLGA